MAKEITLSKGNLCITIYEIKCLIVFFIHFDFGFKEKLENEPRFETGLVLNFAMCSFINLCDPIYNQVSVLLIGML